MAKSSSNIAGETSVTLIARIDSRVVPALDQIAETNQISSAQLMSQFFDDTADAVEFLVAAQGGSFTTVEDWFARFIADRCRETSPETLRAIGHIWYRAADMLSVERGG